MTHYDQAFIRRFDAKWEDVDGHRIWTGAKSIGYGKIFYNGRHVLAHRASYEMHIGPIPDGMVIDHLCRNPSCILPEHLEPVTPAENMRRGAASGGVLRVPPTHCKHGHEFTPENTIIWSGRPNARKCRECGRAATRKWESRIRQERYGLMRRPHGPAREWPDE